jgi:hypothetical protein
MSADIETTNMLIFLDPKSRNHELNVQECVDLINFLTEEGRKEYESRRRSRNRRVPLKDAFYMIWHEIFLQYFHKAYNRNSERRNEQFIKHSIGLISSLNRGTQNQSCLLEKILNQNDNLFPKVVEIILYDQFFHISIPEFRAFFESGGPRIGFLRLWNSFQNLKNVNMTLKEETRLLFNEIGTWAYHPDGLELVFKPGKISRPRNPLVGHDLTGRDELTSLPSEPFAPWLWLLSWQQEKMSLATGSDQIDKMIDFLKMLNQAEVFSKPGRMLYCFALSELYLHPKRTGGPDLETAQKLVDDIAEEHPLALFDPKLPARVLGHCAEMRLKRYQTLLVTPSSGNVWQPEFLQAAPKILPALHALLHWRKHPETAASASESVFDSEPEINSIHEEYLKVILQKLNPDIFAEQKAEDLPKKDSFQGQVCFTVLPRLIEDFMRADETLKDQIALLATQNQASNVLLETMRATLEQYRLELAELFCNEIRNLLSPRPAGEMISPQEQEILVKKKILAHALNWPVAILQQEENRLTQRLAANPEKTSQPQPPEIAILQEGRQQITRLTQRCLNENIRPAEYTQQVQAVLNRVEQKGGAHNSFLTVVARVAANIVIFLSAGLLHSFFKKQIQETRAAPATGFSQYFFSVKSRRAETIHCTSAAVGCGKK